MKLSFSKFFKKQLWKPYHIAGNVLSLGYEEFNHYSLVGEGEIDKCTYAQNKSCKIYVRLIFLVVPKHFTMIDSFFWTQKINSSVHLSFLLCSSILIPIRKYLPFQFLYSLWWSIRPSWKKYCLFKKYEVSIKILETRRDRMVSWWEGLKKDKAGSSKNHLYHLAVFQKSKMLHQIAANLHTCTTHVTENWGWHLRFLKSYCLNFLSRVKENIIRRVFSLTWSVIIVLIVYMERMPHVDNFFGCGWIIGDTDRFKRGVMFRFTRFNINGRLLISVCNGVQLAPLFRTYQGKHMHTIKTSSNVWLPILWLPLSIYLLDYDLFKYLKWYSV